MGGIIKIFKIYVAGATYNNKMNATIKSKKSEMKSKDDYAKSNKVCSVNDI